MNLADELMEFNAAHHPAEYPVTLDLLRRLTEALEPFARVAEENLHGDRHPGTFTATFSTDDLWRAFDACRPVTPHNQSNDT